MNEKMLRMVGVAGRISPWLGEKIAWYLWFHPHGRNNTRYPDRAEEFTVAVFGHRMQGYTIGSGDPVVLLHGWGGASTDMAPLALVLADAGFAAVVPDLPGHGSDRGAHSDVFRMAATVDAVVGRFGPPRAVVAHSFGAVATFAAFQHGGVDKVVLVAPAIKGGWYLEAFRAQLGLADRAYNRFRERFVAFAGPYLMDVLSGRGEVRGAEMLILHDPADDRTSFADTAEFAANRPATKLVEVPGAGHKGILRDHVTREEVVAFVTR